MNTEQEILNELIKIRKLLERENVSPYDQPARNKCLACGHYHPQNMPCPHMMTMSGDI